MALLDATARAVVWRNLLYDNAESCGFTKTDLTAAVAATDQWIENNTASYVAALPAGFRTGSTAPQKSLLFAYVLWKRIGRLT